MEHTPTPWRSSFPSYVIGGGIKICQLKGIYVNNPNREADAEFIVRACNSHDELVAMLKTSYDAIASLDVNVFGSGADEEVRWPIRDELLDKIAKSIAKAKGEE